MGPYIYQLLEVLNLMGRSIFKLFRALKVKCMYVQNLKMYNVQYI